jgi:hypothetical protein
VYLARSTLERLNDKAAYTCEVRTVSAAGSRRPKQVLLTAGNLMGLLGRIVRPKLQG